MMEKCCSRRKFLAALGLSATGLVFTRAGRPRLKPNIVFILVDDLGWSDVGCYNSDTPYETPHVDRLASEGMLFTDFYAAGPVCSPTRASILTGKYPARTGITTYRARFSNRRDH